MGRHTPLVSGAPWLTCLPSRAGGAEAELDAGEEELAPLVELALLRYPRGDVVRGEAASAGDELRDEVENRRRETVWVERSGRESVTHHLDVVEAH